MVWLYSIHIAAKCKIYYENNHLFWIARLTDEVLAIIHKKELKSAS